MRALVPMLLLPALACSTTQHYRYPLADADRSAIEQQLSGEQVELQLHPPAKGGKVESVHLDLDALGFQRGEVFESVPLRDVDSLRLRRPTRGFLQGALAGFLLGSLTGGMVGGAMQDACLRSGEHGDCAAPVMVYEGLLTGALIGTVTLAIAGLFTSSDALTFAPR